ncbi:MAG: hypothetical protein II546_01220, partial [Prevotella sp.]|nr:hypothetical protein [Prevotella sp.]
MACGQGCGRHKARRFRRPHDEYAYDGTDNYRLDVEPWEPNITTLVKFETKWKDM